MARDTMTSRPRAEGSSTDNAPTKQAPRSKASRITSRDGSPQEHAPVLIVEDDDDLRDMMAQLLTLEGFRAHTVANGREALDYLRGGDRPELILLDLMMPIMDGWEFRRIQKDDPELASLPVIVLSALEPTRTSDFGNAMFLTKPLDFDRLLTLVRRYCSGSA
jgi:CheY-like chemotaxis protein